MRKFPSHGIKLVIKIFTLLIVVTVTVVTGRWSILTQKIGQRDQTPHSTYPNVFLILEGMKVGCTNMFYIYLLVFVTQNDLVFTVFRMNI